MTRPTLDDVSELALRHGMELARSRELKTPILACDDRDGRLLTFVIMVPNVHPSDVVHTLLAALDATVAAVCVESWLAELAPTPEQQAELDRGRIPKLDRRVRDFPASQRRDFLVLVSERKGEPTSWRGFNIDTPPRPDGRIERTFAEIMEASEWRSERFSPLFADPATIRRAIRTHAELQRLRDETRERRS